MMEKQGQRLVLEQVHELKRCTKCVMPETQETITFDNKGVCNVCNNQVIKNEKIDWKKKKEEFKELISQYKGKNDYDCIVPFSGGKDSTWTLYSLVKHFGMKPLVVSFDHLFLRPVVLANTKRTMKKLGVDYLKFSPNWKVVRELMLESLRRKGDFCWHCHTGIFSYPMQMAIKLNVPLIIWGETQAEYTAYYSYEDTLNEKEEVDERRFNRFVNLGITAEDMIGMLDDPTIEPRDLEPYTYPKLKDLKAINFRSICLGGYMPWDVKKQVEIIKRELGWKEDPNAGIPECYGYEKIECQQQGIRDYLRVIKRGYGRTAHLTTLDVRNNRLNRKEAEELVRKYDGKRPHSLPLFLEMLGITEEEFNEIARSHIIHPHKWDFSNVDTGPKLHDQDKWDRTQPLAREYTKKRGSECGLL